MTHAPQRHISWGRRVLQLATGCALIASHAAGAAFIVNCQVPDDS